MNTNLHSVFYPFNFYMLRHLCFYAYFLPCKETPSSSHCCRPLPVPIYRTPCTFLEAVEAEEKDPHSDIGRKMASTIGIILGELLLGSKGQNAQSVSLQFQYCFVALTSGVFSMVASFPVIFRDYIQCLCSPENELKDILETMCLVGNMTSSVVFENTKEVIYHSTYQDIPLLLLWLMIANILPTIVWKYGMGDILCLVKDMEHYSSMEVGARVSRLVLFYHRDFKKISISYLWHFATHLVSLGLLFHQIVLCNSMLNHAFWHQFCDLTGPQSDSSRFDQVFTQTVNCTVSNVAPDGQVMTEIFRCILTMNKTFSVMVKTLGILYCVSLVLNIVSIFNTVLQLLPIYRR